MGESSETIDDLPADQCNRVKHGGQATGSRLQVVGSAFARLQDAVSLERRVRNLELDAYLAVIEAFQARSDSIPWIKHLLMFDLRKELSVTDEQHREILTKLSLDEHSRKRRQLNEAPPALATRKPIHDALFSSAVLHSQTTQKAVLATQTHAILPTPQTDRAAPNMPPLGSSAASSKRGGPVGPRGQTSKGHPVVAATSTKSPRGPCAGGGSNLGSGPAPAKAKIGSDFHSDYDLSQRVKTLGKGLYSLL